MTEIEKVEKVVELRRLPCFSGKDERPAAGVRILLPCVAVQPLAPRLVLLQRVQRSSQEAIVVDRRGGHLGYLQLRG